MVTGLRLQPNYSRMERQRKRIFLPIFILAGLLIIAAIILFFTTRYSPPSHDFAAITGVPVPDEGMLYGQMASEYGYSIAMAANLYQQENGDVYVYFTNPEINEVKLRLEIIDKKTQNVLYQTGYIEPGEYIEKINNRSVANRQYDITAKVMAYEDDFTSAGVTELELMLQPW